MNNPVREKKILAEALLPEETVAHVAGGQQKLMFAHVDGLPGVAGGARQSDPRHLPGKCDVARTARRGDENLQPREESLGRALQVHEAQRDVGTLPKQDVVLEVNRLLRSQFHVDRGNRVHPPRGSSYRRGGWDPWG